MPILSSSAALSPSSATLANLPLESNVLKLKCDLWVAYTDDAGDIARDEDGEGVRVHRGEVRSGVCNALWRSGTGAMISSRSCAELRSP